ncbi:MAG TPA: hypothetical protein VLJ60_09925, partial [bacterium]|nr:hypothetical protein [bacterium]
MIKTLNILIIAALFMISCSKIDESHLWVNFYDPEKDSEKRAEICGTVECGNIFYEGADVLCGECVTDHYCSKEQKCMIRCRENSCGEVILVTYFTDIDLTDCGKCPDGELCGSNNICISNENICGEKECGLVEFVDIESTPHNVECGTCDDDEYCGPSFKCSEKTAACTGKCGTVKTLASEGDIDIECGTCEGEFAYCNTGNTCETACQEKECGTHKVTLDSLLEKTFTCGNCGDGNNYCDTANKCKIACTGKECGTDEIETFTGIETFECGSCTIPEYCDSTLSCKTGTQAGDAVYDENIVIDTKTDLMWQRSNSEIMTLESANTHCVTAQTDGFTDWTLPDISKLKTIVSGCAATQTCDITDTCTESTCTNADCNGCTNNSGAGPQELYL